MRIWVDMTAPAYVLVFRPIIARLSAAGHEVEVTARDYAQTLSCSSCTGWSTSSSAATAGLRRAQAPPLCRPRQCDATFGRKRDFDLAVAHGSNDLAIASRMLEIPAVDMFDYEFATLQHTSAAHPRGASWRPRRSRPSGSPLRRRPRKLIQYPGLKEEYYLADFEPDPTCPPGSGVDIERVIVVVRPPPDVSLYHRKSNPLFPQVLTRRQPTGGPGGGAPAHRGSARVRQTPSTCRRWWCRSRRWTRRASSRSGTWWSRPAAR